MMSISCSERLAGLCAVHLGRFEEAHAAFGWAAHWALKHLPAAIGLVYERRYRGPLLEVALLSGDREFLAGAIEADAPATDEQMAPTRACYYRALDSLVKGDDEAARVAAIEARGIPEKRTIRDKFYPGVAEAILAILDRDAARLGRALDRVLERHRRSATGRGYIANSPPGLMNQVAVCLALLARQREIPFRVDARYHKVRLGFKAVYLEEFNGEPVRMKPFHLEADLLPLGFVESVRVRSG
ncbi:MAG: Imm49 family immunity protein [Planctomycetota bacterium]|nr:Imm49 family immunity protein [Planctomycetota bacterium]